MIFSSSLRILADPQWRHEHGAGWTTRSRGSFASRARRAGFSVGWLYWFFWVVVIPVEAIAGAVIIEDWIALLVFNHLVSGADAFVAAHLWDLPAQVSTSESAPRTLNVGIRRSFR